MKRNISAIYDFKNPYIPAEVVSHFLFNINVDFLISQKGPLLKLTRSVSIEAREIL
jgi:hypothetical protein